MIVDELLAMAADGRLAVPSFQRHYVWSRKKARTFMTSLFGGHMCGELVVWDPPNGEMPDVRGAHSHRRPKLLLDGHQRLCALYLLMRGTLPPTCGEGMMRYDPRDMLIDLINGTFSYPERCNDTTRPWVPVTDCYSSPSGDVLARIPCDMRDRAADTMRSLHAIRELQYPTRRALMAYEEAHALYAPVDRWIR